MGQTWLLVRHGGHNQHRNGVTSALLTWHLMWQADRRALNITLNSIGTELTRDDRRKLYSNFGLLYPHGHHELAGAEDFDQIRNAMEKCPPYQALFNKLGYGESQMLDKVRGRTLDMSDTTCGHVSVILVKCTSQFAKQAVHSKASMKGVGGCYLSDTCRLSPLPLMQLRASAIPL